MRGGVVSQFVSPAIAAGLSKTLWSMGPLGIAACSKCLTVSIYKNTAPCEGRLCEPWPLGRIRLAWLWTVMDAGTPHPKGNWGNVFRPEEEKIAMAVRKSVLRPAPQRPELDRLLATSIAAGVTDEQLAEQRVSFAYGNAPEGSRITKDSVRMASKTIKVTGR